MIYWLLFYEFFKIGLFAIGGGAVTIPFLFDLTERYNWFTAQELTDVIAVSQSTRGPVGVNMATYAGFKTIGVLGGIIATLGLVFPSVVIVIMVSKILRKYINNPLWCEVMMAIRPVVVALITMAGIDILKLSITGWFEAIFAILFFIMVYFYKKSPIFYIILSAILGIILEV
jgi:chromate transporter